MACTCRWWEAFHKATDARQTKDLTRLLCTDSVMQRAEGPALLEIQVNKGGRKDLGRPTRSPIENKEDFMDFLADD